jgi:hypothetical protein
MIYLKCYKSFESYTVCSHGLPDALSPHFHHSNLTVGDLKVQNLQPNICCFRNLHTIQSFILFLWHHNDGYFLNTASALEAVFSRLKQNLTQILSFLRPTISLSYDYGIDQHSSVICTKIQFPVTATLTALNHNKSTY